METDHRIGHASGERVGLGLSPFRRDFEIAIAAPRLLKKRASQEGRRDEKKEDKRRLKMHDPT